MKKKILFILLITLIVANLSCGFLPKKSNGIFGTVLFLSMEGGFYGIVSDTGQKYDPINLPKKFEIDGLKVEFWPEPFDGFTSFHMWGELVEIEKIKAIGD